MRPGTSPGSGIGTTIMNKPIAPKSSYCPVAVNAAIASSNRAGRRIGGKEARLIHALLKGR